MPTTYEAGGAGSLSVAATTIPIKNWKAKLVIKDQDTTSSKDWNTSDSLLYKSQIKTSIGLDFTAEGFLDTTTYKSGLVNQLKKTDAPVAVVLKLDAATTYASFNADVLTVDIDMEVDGVIKITASGKSNGQITF